jgi:hypothetical protein
MPAYDRSRFEPPAPVAAVELRNPSSGAVLPGVLLLIDSGADVTLLPDYAVKALRGRVEEGRQYELTAFDGSTTMASSVRLDLVFLNRTFRGLFLLTTQECGILGRDVLNHVAVLLNGPKEEWQEHSAGTPRKPAQE